ncbi:MAG: helix-turn-helix transcriptional regulator [Acidobacteria bacterium]|nr:helix-turn-helix transcriptional regulator [Acidobacteriota bacterium]
MLYRMQAGICRVLAHPRRLHILDLLAGGEKSSQQLERELGISKMNLSQHLALMKHAGLVESRTEGRAALHRLALREIKDACGMIRSVLAARLERGSQLARSLR